MKSHIFLAEIWNLIAPIDPCPVKDTEAREKPLTLYFSRFFEERPVEHDIKKADYWKEQLQLCSFIYEEESRTCMIMNLPDFKDACEHIFAGELESVTQMHRTFTYEGLWQLVHYQGCKEVVFLVHAHCGAPVIIRNAPVLFYTNPLGYAIDARLTEEALQQMTPKQREVELNEMVLPYSEGEFDQQWSSWVKYANDRKFSQASVRCARLAYYDSLNDDDYLTDEDLEREGNLAELGCLA